MASHGRLVLAVAAAVVEFRMSPRSLAGRARITRPRFRLWWAPYLPGGARRASEYHEHARRGIRLRRGRGSDRDRSPTKDVRSPPAAVASLASALRRRPSPVLRSSQDASRRGDDGVRGSARADARGLSASASASSASASSAPPASSSAARCEPDPRALFESGPSAPWTARGRAPPRRPGASRATRSGPRGPAPRPKAALLSVRGPRQDLHDGPSRVVNGQRRVRLHHQRLDAPHPAASLGPQSRPPHGRWNVATRPVRGSSTRTRQTHTQPSSSCSVGSVATSGPQWTRTPTVPVASPSCTRAAEFGAGSAPSKASRATTTDPTRPASFGPRSGRRPSRSSAAPAGDPRSPSSAAEWAEIPPIPPRPCSPLRLPRLRGIRPGARPPRASPTLSAAVRGRAFGAAVHDERVGLGESSNAASLLSSGASFSAPLSAASSSRKAGR